MGWFRKKPAPKPLFGMPRDQLMEAVVAGVRLAKEQPDHVRLTPGQYRHITGKSLR